MKLLCSTLLSGVALLASAASSQAAPLVQSICESVAGRQYVFEMSGDSTVTNPNDSSVIGRIKLTAGKTDGTARLYMNNWNNLTGLASTKVTCTELSDRIGRFVFTGAGASFQADFVLKYDFDKLILMRTDPKQAITGEAIESAPVPEKADPCKLPRGLYAGAMDGWSTTVDDANLLQVPFPPLAGKFIDTHETTNSSANLITGSVECQVVGTEIIRIILNGGTSNTRRLISFPGGPKFDSLPVVDNSPARPSSGWLFSQPDPIEIPF